MKKLSTFLLLALVSTNAFAQMFDVPDYSFCTTQEHDRCMVELKEKVDATLPSLVDIATTEKKSIAACKPRRENLKIGRNVYMCRDAQEKRQAKIIVNINCVCYNGKLIYSELQSAKVRFDFIF